MGSKELLRAERLDDALHGGAREPDALRDLCEAEVGCFSFQRAQDTRGPRLLRGKLARLTSHSLTKISTVLADVATCHTRGYAHDEEEHTEGISAVGVALLDPLGPPASNSGSTRSARMAILGADADCRTRRPVPVAGRSDQR
jgi:hypothetical protein